jgi:3-hydroxyisobutyrate dehydrogenase
MTEPALGFIGIGKMGLPMTLRLLAAGYRVIAFNRTPGRLQAVRDAGAEVADSPAAVAAGADIVFLCLTDTHAVEEVTFGEAGLAAGGKAGKLVVDCSSISPDATRRIADRLAATAGTRWVDAPVSGGVEGARRGTLIFMCGGEPGEVERVAPILGRLGQRSTHMGPVGSGQAAKLCNQAIVSCNLAAIAEVLNLAQRAGVGAARLPQALAGGFADSLPLQIYGPRMAAPAGGEPMGEVATMMKDVENVFVLARALGVSMPMTAAARDLYRRTAELGYLHADLENLMRLYDDR